MTPNYNTTLLTREHRTDSGEINTYQLNITSIAIETLCQSCLRLVKHASQAKNLKVSATFDTLSMMSTVQADKARLTQTLVALLHHAIQVTPEGKAIGLKVRTDLKANMLHFSIWNQGSDHKLDPMISFQSPFGFDLSLVQHLITLHGGTLLLEKKNHIRAENRLTVSLPWQESQSNPSRRYLSDKIDSVTQFFQKSYQEQKNKERKEYRLSTAKPIPSHTFTQKRVSATISARSYQTTSDHYPLPSATQPLILLAEDNEANVSTLTEYLPTKGYRVVVARDGLDALQRAHQIEPDLILMDVQMPRMDGLEATRTLRRHSSFAHTPIIALTALAMRGDRERCLEAGVNDYLSKPFSLKHLVKLIEKNLKMRKLKNS